MVFGLLKRVAGGAAREVASEYGQNKDFLEAVCAAAALVAAADGDIEEAEKRKVVALITNHATLGKLYKSSDIEGTASAMFARAKDASGRQQLARELDDIKDKPAGAKMAEDVYLLALDIAHADGEVEPAEEKVLAKIASRLGVNPSDFEF